MNRYETKQAARRERMQDRADNLRRKANSEFDKADLREEKSGIPFGQPILVGHHSERKHRNALKRADQAMRRAIDASDYADELERRANIVNPAISSDDEDATKKLKEKLEKLEANQTMMKKSMRWSGRRTRRDCLS